MQLAQTAQRKEGSYPCQYYELDSSLFIDVIYILMGFTSENFILWIFAKLAINSKESHYDNRTTMSIAFKNVATRC